MPLIGIATAGAIAYASLLGSDRLAEKPSEIGLQYFDGNYCTSARVFGYELDTENLDEIDWALMKVEGNGKREMVYYDFAKQERIILDSYEKGIIGKRTAYRAEYPIVRIVVGIPSEAGDYRFSAAVMKNDGNIVAENEEHRLRQYGPMPDNPTPCGRQE